MNFLAPAAFFLALLLPVIIAMYLLKLRRAEQVVSSVYLWRRMVRDVEANAPWQRLRRNLLLIFQLLFLIFLILALTRPFTWVQGAGGQAAIFIVDVSASMSAADVPPNRLEEAKAQARQLANELPEETRVTVIAAGDGAQVLAASSRDRRQVLQAIDSLLPALGGSDLTPALQLASALASRQPDTEIILLSDGRVTLPERLALKGRVRYYPIGSSGENQAISLLSLEATAGGSLTAFAQIGNYGDQPAHRRLELYAGGELVNAYDLEIPPQGQRAVIAEDLPPETRLIEARLVGTDAFPTDDSAWAVYRPSKPAAITLVTEGNLFLNTALSLLPWVEVTTVAPKDWKNRRLVDGSQPSDFPAFQPSLTILDSFIPTSTTSTALSAGLPSGNLFFIAPPRSSEFFTVTGTLDAPTLRAVNTEDPLLANVSLTGVNVLDTVQIPLPDWARPVIVGEAGGETIPLLFAGEVEGRRVAVLAFDLHHSDLPLQVAFPVLLSNLIGWLAPSGGSELPTQLAPGAATSIPAPLEVESVTLTRPDGSRARLTPERGQVTLAEINQLGVYRLEWGEAEPLWFAVNLFSPQESDVKPAGTLPLSPPNLGGEGGQEGEHPQQTRREWWRPLAFAALIFMIAEWLIYQRATLARLWANRTRIIS